MKRGVETTKPQSRQQRKACLPAPEGQRTPQATKHKRRAHGARRACPADVVPATAERLLQALYRLSAVASQRCFDVCRQAREDSVKGSRALQAGVAREWWQPAAANASRPFAGEKPRWCVAGRAKQHGSSRRRRKRERRRAAKIAMRKRRHREKANRYMECEEQYRSVSQAATDQSPHSVAGSCWRHQSVRPEGSRREYAAGTSLLPHRRDLRQVTIERPLKNQQR